MWIMLLHLAKEALLHHHCVASLDKEMTLGINTEKWDWIGASLQIWLGVPTKRAPIKRNASWFDAWHHWQASFNGHAIIANVTNVLPWNTVNRYATNEQQWPRNIRCVEIDFDQHELLLHFHNAGSAWRWKHRARFFGLTRASKEVFLRWLLRVSACLASKRIKNHLRMYGTPRNGHIALNSCGLPCAMFSYFSEVQPLQTLLECHPKSWHWCCDTKDPCMSSPAFGQWQLPQAASHAQTNPTWITKKTSVLPSNHKFKSGILN